ncbi:MAG TPA: methyltransferase domain-containing protein [Cellulomonas sp.]|uniref:class I SAM-dependent methyltransferase n=1 Tax=Cellulomonas sp. TaxID=40001 RepID=UPI002E312AE4|nr:methyltransferase domain-containing protein [Cellulomonas sp.]HEX5333377.1 methyltransferase domain-containing protein [Cellulomonas sp.]
MSFDVAAESYDRFMGRFSRPLAPVLADFADVRSGQRALDVGCGPGALTGELVRRLGADAVAAVDPSAPFVAALAERFPGVQVASAVAEHLPHPDASFDRTLAQLVVHFMKDPVAGVREMARVTRPGGVVAACVWDESSDAGPLHAFYRGFAEVVPDVETERGLVGVREGDLAAVYEAAGLTGTVARALRLTVPFASFDEWWGPFTLGAGPAGAQLATLDPGRREDVRLHCRALLPAGPFEVDATAWAVRAVV